MTFTERKQLHAEKERFIEKALKGIDKQSAILQRRFVEMLVDELISDLETKDKKLQSTTGNFRAINQLDDIFNRFSRQFTRPFIEEIGQKMLETIKYTEGYFIKGFNPPLNVLNQIEKNTAFIYERIGITKTGKIITGSYLDKLANFDELRNTVRNYVTQNVVGGSGYFEFQKGFKKLIKGADDKTGKLQQYYKQYTFDVFNQVDSAIAKTYAEALELNYFIYFGEVMERTRCFCEKRNNMIFSVDDTKDWKHDVALLDFYKENPYNPLIDRGGFNCRHDIIYIDEATAKARGYDPVRVKEILEETC
jgi:hypothetical protein